MNLAYDAATPWSVDRLQVAKAHGAQLVTFYIVGSPGGMRCANRADVAAARALGLGVLPNWERAADFFRTATSADAFNAGREARTACLGLGIPAGTAVAFSFDYQIPTSGYARAAGLLAQCAAGMGGTYPAIAYGQSGFLAYLAAHGQPGPHWLMGSTWGPSSQFTPAEVNQPYVGLVQSHDANGNWWTPAYVPATDVNTLIHPETLAAWWPDDSPYGADMPLTDADVAKVAAAVWAANMAREKGQPQYPAGSWLTGAGVHAGLAEQAACQVADLVKAIPAAQAPALSPDVAAAVTAAIAEAVPKAVAAALHDLTLKAQ